MKPITELSQGLVNRIAAGEVIERPASVVKELVENAIDAGATRVDVAIGKGGFDLVRVSDNGSGIPADQLTLAISPHATSKLLTDDDLFRISTFGFRGEALASIAEISHFTIRSRVAGVDAGAELSVRGGLTRSGRANGADGMDGASQDIRTVPAACAVGTTIEVRNLFFNTPVRRRFLKSVSTEFGYINESLIRIALAAPQVHFTLTHNGKLIQELPVTVTESSDGRLERITAIFGKQIADALIPVTSEGRIEPTDDDPVRVSGYVALPALSRGNNRTQYTFLNHRHIRDRSILAAVSEAYRGLLTVGRCPIAFLWLEIPFDRVDVNVHPTKLEVRFQDSGRVYSLILSAIRTQFLRTNLIKRLPTETTEGTDSGDGRGSGDDEPEELRRMNDRTREAIRESVRTERSSTLASFATGGRGGGVPAFRPFSDRDGIRGNLAGNIRKDHRSGTEIRGSQTEPVRSEVSPEPERGTAPGLRDNRNEGKTGTDEETDGRESERETKPAAYTEFLPFSGTTDLREDPERCS
ncbi:MAG: DNA mismatch repair endonuclease MutL, partial [Planctomycetia bacterium]|nr:DNA mismatch repair endonuclease MutL [Planctomycetia bacterium]